MVTTSIVSLDKGVIEINYNKAFQPFKITYQDIGNDSIQLDITGKGLLNYHGKIDTELLLEINTNILTSINEYSYITGHSSANVGHHLNLLQTKKYNSKHNTHEVELDACIVFKKPVMNTSAYSLQPTITVITSIILEEIFIHD